MPYFYIILAVLYLFGLFFIASLAGTIMSRIAELRALILNAEAMVETVERRFKAAEAAFQNDARADGEERIDPASSKKERVLQ